MAKNNEQQRPTFGPQEGESAADAYPGIAELRSRDTADYVLITRVHPEADGLVTQEQVLKTDLEEADEYSGVSLDDDNVVEAHPAANRPTSNLTTEERVEEERVLPGQDEPGQTDAEKEDS